MSAKEKGFIPVMLTPFKDNGAVDFDGLTRLTEFYINAGASGLFANCLSSEMFELSAEERLKVTAHVVKVAAGKIPVVATGTFGGEVAKQADFVKQIYDVGVQAVIVISSLLANKEDSYTIFEQNVFELMKLAENIPLGFYECPAPYKRLITPAQIKLFTATGRVIYHKDTCLDVDMVKAKLAQVANPDFGLYDAYMAHAVASLKAGAAGLSCIQGNFFPELITWLCKNYAVEALQEEVNQVQQFFIKHMEVMHHGYPHIAKYYLQSNGLNISTYTRRIDEVSFSPTLKKHIDDLGADYVKLITDLSILQTNATLAS